MGYGAESEPHIRLTHALRLQLVTRDREYLSSRKEAARRGQANGRPLQTVFMEVDAANQAAYALPTIYPHTHGSNK